jgi:glycosyltransferase involved in cell wall biosynthesis
VRILIVSPFLYGEASASGGESLGRVFLERLAERHSVTLVAFTSGRTEAEVEADRAELSGWVEDVRIVSLRPSKFRKALSKAAVLRGDPSAPILYEEQEFEAAIQASLAAFPPDVAIVQFPELAQYVGALSGVPTVLDVVDAYSVSKFRRCLQARGLPNLLWAYAQWLGWVRYERRHYPSFDVIFTLTDQDTYGLKLFSPSLPAVTAGVAFDAPAEAPEGAQAGAFDIGFAASFGHRPNMDAIEYFVAKILPEVRRAVPQARFVIAGRNPPPHLAKLQGEGVEVVGFVPDIYDFFRSCAVVAVPLLWGGGVKVKVVQALLAGAPIVTTSIGAEGTGAIDGEHLIVKDSPEAFAAGLIHLLTDPKERATLSSAAAAFAAAEFSWPAKMARLEQVMESAKAAFNRRSAVRGETRAG